ncbi:MAG: GxxExxY protein [Saprospiraceae bacterium]|nr:GxxExxY protein [Saprospiraceae bacterium]
MSHLIEELTLDSELTYKIIGCAMSVHRALGNGFQEVIYQRALVVEFDAVGLNFLREKEIDIFYKGFNIGTRRVDFLVEDRIIVEIKATTHLEPAHMAQAINYIEAFGFKIGLLLNFGCTSLQYKRVFKSITKSVNKNMNHNDCHKTIF